MTRLNSAALVALHSACVDIVETLATTPVSDDGQHLLDLTGEEQACEEFMAERRELQANYAALEGLYSNQRATIAALFSEKDNLIEGNREVGRQLADAHEENRELADTLVQASRFFGSVKAQLTRLGITIAATENGTPGLSINIVELANAVDGIIHAN